MFALINNGIVVQVQPNEEVGFVTVPAGTVCGMVQNADGTFSAPGPTLAQAQTAQTALLRSSCQTDITGGFMSSALGDIYNYPSGSTDQINLHTIAGNLHGGNLWCEAGGIWSFKYHTQSQAQMVLSDFSSWLNTCQSKLLSLTEQVNNATTVEAVKAIVF